MRIRSKTKALVHHGFRIFTNIPARRALRFWIARERPRIRFASLLPKERLLSLRLCRQSLWKLQRAKKCLEVSSDCDFPSFLSCSNLPTKAHLLSLETTKFPSKFPEVSSFHTIHAKMETSLAWGPAAAAEPIPFILFEIRLKGRPQVRFPLSRGFAVSGFSLGAFCPGWSPESIRGRPLG
jgi:hypothetical protein